MLNAVGLFAAGADYGLWASCRQVIGRGATITGVGKRAKASTTGDPVLVQMTF
jgi:hypothetical protein